MLRNFVHFDNKDRVLDKNNNLGNSQYHNSDIYINQGYIPNRLNYQKDSIKQKDSKPKKVITVEIKPRPTFEQHQELVTQSFAKSGVERWLGTKGFEFVADTAIDPNGVSVFPIDEFLNPEKHLVTQGHQARANQSALLMFNEDGSAYQAIINRPHKDKPYQYLAPTGAGNRAFLPHIPRAVRRAIVKRYGRQKYADLLDAPSFWDWVAAHPEISIILTEGVKKALSLLQQGYVAIAVYGCSCLGSPDLNRFLPGRKITIAMDSDSQPSTVAKVGRAILGKVAELRRKGAFRVLVATWNSNLGKGIDDLWQGCGSAAVEDAIANAITEDVFRAILSGNKSALEAAKKRLEVNKIQPDLELTALPSLEELQAIHKDHRDIFLVGAKGLGKSVLGGEFVRSADYALLPVPLEALARNNADRLSDEKNGIWVDYRTECDSFKGRWIGKNGYSADRLSFCTEAIQQLTKHIENCLQSGAAAFNDELDLQLNSLATSPTHGQQGKRKFNENLYWQIQIRSAHTLSVSADLTKYEAELWERKTGRKPYVIKVNTPKKTYPCLVYEDNLVLQKELDKAIKNGDRILAMCSRKSEVKYLAWLYRDYGAIGLHRDNAHEPIFEGFFEKPNEWVKKHKPKLLFVSPIVRTGFSITEDVFDKEFCIYHSDSIAASTALQQSDRYRPQIPRYMYAAESNGKYRHCTPEDILKTSKGRAIANGNDEITHVDEFDPYYHYKAEDNWSKANFRADFLARLEDEVEVVEINSEASGKEDKQAYRDSKASFNSWQREQILSARNLTPLEFKVLKDRRDLLEADCLAVEKFRLANWSDRTPESVTLSQIERDRKGRKREALERLERQAYPALAIAADHTSRDMQSKWGAGVAYQDVSHLSLAQKALEEIGAHEFLDFALSGGSWSADTPISADLAAKLRSLRSGKIDRLAEAGIHLMCGRDSNNNSYIGALLQWLGLATDSKKISSDGKRTRVYFLCQADLGITREELSRRATRMIREGLELHPSHPFVERLYEVSTPFVEDHLERCGQGEIVASEDAIDPSPPLPPDEPKLIPLANPQSGQKVAIVKQGKTIWGTLLSWQAEFCRVNFPDGNQIVSQFELQGVA